MKHRWNIPFYYEGKRYMPVNGIIDIPVYKENMNPLEDKPEEKKSEKDLLIKEAESLGMAVSKLKRNSTEKIKEAIAKYKEDL